MRYVRLFLVLLLTLLAAPVKARLFCWWMMGLGASSALPFLELLCFFRE